MTPGPSVGVTTPSGAGVFNTRGAGLTLQAHRALATAEAGLRQRSTIQRFLRFLVVGAGAAVCYLGTLALVVDGLGGSLFAGLTAAFAVGTLVSYLGNTLWSFGALMAPDNMVRFLVVTLLGLGANLGIGWLLEQMGLHHLLIGLIILVVVPLLNFVGHHFWTYGPPPGEPGQ